jgi:tetratricopeptide (TPR) repeat protein
MAECGWLGCECWLVAGNLLRLKGETRLAIECFRRALAVTPHSAEILLNLARVLFRLQYLDDAIFLTRRSLEVQPPELNAWQQHFQLGEILKAYCHHQEAALHLRWGSTTNNNNLMRMPSYKIKFQVLLSLLN